MRYIICTFFLISYISITAQPEPCGPVPIMANNCADACVICDIDGYTGTNNLNNGGQSLGNIFCSTPNDMHFIAFIAGSTSLSIEITVTNCIVTQGGWQSLDLGFYQSDDCQNFSRITTCREDLEGGDSFIFNTTVPLIVGLHYYLVMDGTAGSICDWTFNVIDGSTKVFPLSTSGIIDMPEETCPNMPVTISTSGEQGTSLFYWSINGDNLTDISQSIEYEFEEDGVYEVCVTGANACDEAPPSCDSIRVRTPMQTDLVEVICDLDCIEINGVDYCDTGFYVESLKLANGCDSIVTLDLTVLPQARETVDVWICNIDTFFIGTTPYTQTGEYEETILTTQDCDSLVLLDLLVIECEIQGDSYEIPVACNGTASGILVFSVDQGTPPLNYTYTNVVNGLSGTGTTNLLEDNQITGLPIGTYQIYIEDEFGNDVVFIQEITEPAVIESSLEPSIYGDYNLSCFMHQGMAGSDGVLTADFSGGVTPYEYYWSDGQTTEEAIGLLAQQYTVTMTDAVGCTKTDSFLLTGPPEMVPEVIFENPNCDGYETGSIQIMNVSGGTPGYEFALENNNFSSDSLYENLIGATYTVLIQDDNDCIISVVDSISPPDIPEVELGDDLTILLGDSILLEPVLNNTSVNQIAWSNENSLSCGDCLEPYAFTVNNLEYTLTITSDDLCSRSDSITINVDKRRRVYVPNIFSPEGNDPLNDKLIFHTGPEVDRIEDFRVYDRWGNLVFEAIDFAPNDSASGWNGRYNNAKLNTGLFVWTANVHFIDNVTLPYNGQITIFK